ncbi:insulinase family protein [Pseudomonas syringae pv. actinidiae]|nr:insulinase family protein [Pseudomonas syringae pv. actinidiae]
MNAGIPATVTTPEAASVVLQAIVDVGTTSSCGLREAPHLIEHLLLSDTEYGASPVDAVLTLRAQGIKLSAITRSDFTQYTLEGPAEKAALMGKALATFLGRASLPISGFEREKQAIMHEVRADQSYVSSPSFYERFVAVNAGGVQPCAADAKPFLGYGIDEVQAVYDGLYRASAIKLVARAGPDTFDFEKVEAGILKGHNPTAAVSSAGKREEAKTIQVIGSGEQVEIIFPIAGREILPEDAASAFADQARLEVQAYIRREFQLYTARSYVDQSIRGGWIRLEVPDVSADKAKDLVAVAQAAILSVRTSDYASDPVWQAYGARRSAMAIGIPVVADAGNSSRTGMVREVKTVIEKLLGR